MTLNNDQSYQFFIEEVPEALAQIETGLLSLRSERSLGKVHEIMRAAHSLKGGAASVGLEGIQFLAHRLEDFFKALYDETLVIDVELESALLQGFDCLKNALMEFIETGSSDFESARAKAEPIFQELEALLGSFLKQGQDYLPSSADLGVDLRRSIFEVDVQQVLDHLDGVLARSDSSVLAGELLATVEMFTGFAQMFNLPGLIALTTAVQKALENHPEQVLKIATLAKGDFYLCQQAILSGDDESGPCAALLALAAPSSSSVVLPQQSSLNKPPLHEQAYPFFVEEAGELLQVIETELLTLRAEKTRAKVHGIMRAAHSIKGGAASVGLETIRTIAHGLEDYFKALYGDDIEVDTELEGLLLEGFDCLKNPLVQQIETGFHDEEAALATAQTIFKKIECRLGDALKAAEQYLPSSEELGVDVAASIFETDVPEELRRLVEVVANPQEYEVAGELRATAEVLAGFAELLNLPGLGEIAAVAIEGLEHHPDRAVEIAKAALADFQAARERVLGGDRLSGGTPSPELLALARVDAEPSPYQFFIEEAGELLQVIDEGLEFLRDEKTKAKVHEIMRAAHSLKGGAAVAGLETIRVLAYRTEKIFKALFDDEVVIDEGLMGRLVEGYHCLKTPLEALIHGQKIDDVAAQERAEPIFGELELLLADALGREEAYIPSSADLGIDIASSIFEIDVQQELDKLAEVLAGGNGAEVACQLLLAVEVLSSFAELFNLSGFGAICGAARAAIERHEECALEIASVVWRDLTEGRELVLAGDRTMGGNPSAELLGFVEDVPAISMVDAPSLDDVFALGEEMLRVSPVVEEFAPVGGLLADEFSLSLDDIFGAVPEVLEDEAVEGDELPVLSLDEVFGPGEVAGDLLEVEELSLAAPSLDEVFGPGEAAGDLLGVEELSPSVPSLDEVFGSIEAVTPSFASEAERLAQVVSFVEENFETLPVVDEEELSTGAAKPGGNEQKPSANGVYGAIPDKTVRQSPTKQVSGKEILKSEAASLSVRVDFNRLERMNNLVGELAINRNSLSLQNSQLQSSVKELVNRFSRFHSIGNKLRELSDLMLVDASIASGSSHQFRMGSGSGRGSLEDEALSGDKSDFDTLEMDRYGSVYSLLQSILEEMLQLEESVDDIVLFARGSNQTLEQQRQMLTSLRDELMWARMLPLGEVLNRFPRVLRDLSATYHKSVQLKLVGTGVLVDRAALEKLYDPLLHLLRNAFDHGIESPVERQKRFKPEEGTIEIRAYHQGNQTIIEIKDDGNGLNLEKIRMTALRMNIVTPEQLAVMSNENVAELIFEPGFSTAAKVTQLSGRGVGLDVVRSQLRSFKGAVSVNSEPGQGTTFVLRLPLTMTIAKLLVCLINTKALDGGVSAIALPSDSIEEIIIPEPEQIKRSGEQRFLSWQEQIIPIYPVCDLLEYHCPVPKTFSSKVLDAVPMPSDWGLPLLLVRLGQQIFALEVNRLVTEQELVIKPFGSCVAPPSYTYGCTILGDGTLIPVLNGIILLEQSLEPSRANVPGLGYVVSPPAPATVEINQTPTVLVVDDSAALRRTLALTLQKAGYRVMQARDGREALSVLQQNTNIQLVICDVEMPNMNGFEFLGQRRRYPELNQIPVAMLTSRSSEKHRQLAAHLGASAYFTKPYIEQQFLASVENIVKQNSQLTVNSQQSTVNS